MVNKEVVMKEVVNQEMVNKEVVDHYTQPSCNSDLIKLFNATVHIMRDYLYQNKGACYCCSMKQGCGLL